MERGHKWRRHRQKRDKHRIGIHTKRGYTKRRDKWSGNTHGKCTYIEKEYRTYTKRGT